MVLLLYAGLGVRVSVEVFGALLSMVMLLLPVPAAPLVSAATIAFNYITRRSIRTVANGGLIPSPIEVLLFVHT